MENESIKKDERKTGNAGMGRGKQTSQRLSGPISAMITPLINLVYRNGNNGFGLYGHWSLNGPLFGLCGHKKILFPLLFLPSYDKNLGVMTEVIFNTD